MQLKSSVKFRDHSQAMCVVMIIVNDVFKKHNLSCVITSANDGVHSPRSLHYKDMGLDFRTKHVPRSKPVRKKDDILSLILEEIRMSLTIYFDVVFEDEGGTNEHLHIEWDPKQKK